MEGDLATIRKATSELLAAVNACDVNRVVDLWADDGVLMPPAHPSVHGRAALREYFGRLFLRARFAFEFTSSEIEIVTDAAFERVGYKVTIWPTDGQSPTEDCGKGLHVYRRQLDGTWKLCVDIWNSDRPGEPRPLAHTN